jgi:hypothetical protein
MKHGLILIVVVALATSAVVASTNAVGATAKSIDFTGVITGFHVALDAKPAGQSPGDIGYETGNVLQHGKRVGRLQGVCTVLPRSSQQCSFTIGLPGGQIVVESGYGPSYNLGSTALEAVVGGTGIYAGAHGQARDREVGNTKLVVHVELTQ